MMWCDNTKSDNTADQEENHCIQLSISLFVCVFQGIQAKRYNKRKYINIYYYTKLYIIVRLCFSVCSAALLRLYFYMAGYGSKRSLIHFGWEKGLSALENTHFLLRELSTHAWVGMGLNRSIIPSYWCFPYHQVWYATLEIYNFRYINPPPIQSAIIKNVWSKILCHPTTTYSFS